MLATFVIGLREGLEAVLIVSIVATFLRKNGRSLSAMWVGVGGAVALSVAVGVTLRLIESSLPQAAQEGMETVIGAIAIVFVTGMVIWMASHSRGLKRELEASATDALSDGTSTALAMMAFLAVLREGFETAVFLLATFSASRNPAAAASGAVLGIAAAIVLGLAIFSGGVRINLGKFFKGTSIFLVLVAAGLVVNALRTAHEAGWLNAGQQRTVDLGWLAPAGSIRGALFTGVLGIPPDPRLVEVIGWFVYLIPMLLFLFWPAAHRPNPATAFRLKAEVAGALVIGALVLAVAIPRPTLAHPSSAPVVDDAGTRIGSASLSGNTVRTTIRGVTSSAPLKAARDVHHATADVHTGRVPGAKSQLTLEDLFAFNGNRLPVGFNAGTSPGPYTASWSRSSDIDVTRDGSTLLNASGQDQLTVTLHGGGLPYPRTIGVPTTAAVAKNAGIAGTWRVEDSYATRLSHKRTGYTKDQTEANFWGRTLPIAMVIGAAVLLLSAFHARRRNQSTPHQEPGATATGTTNDDRAHVVGSQGSTKQ